MKNLARSAALTALVLLGANGAASAASVVDRDNSGPYNVGYCTNECDWQQEITAGLTGQLTGVAMFGSGTAEVRIAEGSGFISNSWVADIVGAQINGGIIDLSADDIFLKAGDKFVIDITNDTGSLAGNIGAPSTGKLFLAYPGGNLDYSQFGDYQLNYVTYVDTSATPAVPEPASLAMMGLGLAGICAVRRRKKAV